MNSKHLIQGGFFTPVIMVLFALLVFSCGDKMTIIKTHQVEQPTIQNDNHYAGFLYDALSAIDKSAFDSAQVFIEKSKNAGCPLWEYFYYRGILFHAQADHLTAIERFESGLNSHPLPQLPERADIYYRLGICCEETDQNSKAILHYRMALNLNPGHEQAKDGLSRLNLSQLK